MLSNDPFALASMAQNQANMMAQSQMNAHARMIGLGALGGNGLAGLMGVGRHIPSQSEASFIVKMQSEVNELLNDWDK